MNAVENLARRLADAAEGVRERRIELQRATRPDPDAVPYVDEAGFVWCNQVLAVDDRGAPSLRCTRQLWSLTDLAAGHVLPCRDGFNEPDEPGDDVDFGSFPTPTESEAPDGQ